MVFLLIKGNESRGSRLANARSSMAGGCPERSAVLRFTFVAIFATSMMLISLCVVFADEGAEEPGKVEFSGILEGEFGYTMAEGDDESGFALATVELSADVSLAPNVDGHLLFLYEQGENDDNIAVDEGTIDLKIPGVLPVELSLSLGRMYVPFGEFDSHFVADPFTLEIGETGQVALRLSASHEIVEASAAFYNEEVGVEGGNNTQIGDIAARIVASAPEGALGKDMNLSLGGSFITNMAGTDGLTDMIVDGEVSERGMGLGGFISLGAMGAFLEGEVVLALSDIEMPDGGTLKPGALNIELGYSLPGMPVEIAIKFEQLSEDGDNFTSRFGGVVSLGLFDETASLALEFLRTDDGDTAENSIVGQLAAGF
jgi:hypothetical protein